MCCISVIVPVYNSENTLVRCVDSILSQTFSDFELLLVDDGSTDSSGKMCDDYGLKDNRVYVFHKKNGGVSSARNVGLDNASGKWIAFCDSDDYVDSCWLSTFIESCKDEVEIVVQSTGISNSKKNRPFEGTVSAFLELFYDVYVIGYVWNKLFLKSVIDKYCHRFDESFVFLEDEMFVCKYLQFIDNVAFIPKLTYHYEMPDFNNKYKGDNFEPHYAIYIIIKVINSKSPIPNTVEYYIKLLRRSLFDSFLKRDSDRKNKLLRYQQLLAENSSVLRSFPFVWRMILECPNRFAYVMLNLMAYVRRIIKVWVK